MLRVGINGFGRIGRAVFRINAQNPRCEIVAVNDLDPNLENLAYLLKYDSIYGRFGGSVEARPDQGRVLVDGRAIAFHSQADIARVPWRDHGVDVVIDATGVTQNRYSAAGLVADGSVRKVVFTNAPGDGVDRTVVFGVNDHLVSTSICDANAIAPVLKVLDENFGIAHGYVTTLHPWLSYQNLSDGSVQSIASPGHFWNDFGLGRASTTNLIPKNTTAMGAVRQVLPHLPADMDAMSFRIPTAIVSTSDMTIGLRDAPSAGDINAALGAAAAARPRIVGFGTEPLVSQDYLGIEQSLVVDGRWTRANGAGACKIIVWYDNEWGYSQRVVDMVALMEKSWDTAPASAEVLV